MWPVIVPDFMPEMADKGPVRLRQPFAQLFALHGIRLLQKYGYNAIGMAGHCAFRVVSGKEVEHHSMRRAFRFPQYRQTQPEQLEYEPPLGKFELPPLVQVFRIPGPGGFSRETATKAPGMAGRLHKPVTNINPEIPAVPVGWFPSRAPRPRSGDGEFKVMAAKAEGTAAFHT